MPSLSTPRLWLRRWKVEDREPFARINADPKVMEHFPGTLDPDASDHLIERIEDHFENHGFGLWALETKGESELIGFCGLAVPNFETDFTPAVEVGWRLGRNHWGNGYATEAAGAVLDHGFGEAGLDPHPELGASRQPPIDQSHGANRAPAGS